jgi:multiple sugar transport system ATP-binding protein
VQIGTPYEIYDQPTTTFVAQLVGVPRINLMPAERENGQFTIGSGAVKLPVPVGRDIPTDFLLGIRPEDVHPDSEGQHIGVVTLTEPMGVETVLHIKSGQQTLLSIVPGITDLKLGDTVRYSIVQERLHFFNREGKRV